MKRSATAAAAAPKRKPPQKKTAAAPVGDIGHVFMQGRSQAVRLPKAFRLPGDRVRGKRVGQSLVLEPLEFDVKAMFAELDRILDHSFLPEGRPEQPPMPEDKDLFA